MYEIGKIYSRKDDIHAHYEGQRQGGISTPSKHPYIFLFTGQSGEQYGYSDGWDDDGVFIYTGEGQAGDMEFVRGNLAIRDHAINGKELLLFESLGKGKGYRFLGDFSCSSWEYRQGLDKDGALRRVIVFHLINQPIAGEPPSDKAGIAGKSIEELRQLAYKAAQPAVKATESQAKSNYYERSAAVRDYVLARAAGTCEACGKPAPFERKDGTAYLEPHHTRRISDGGPDHPRWVGAICPNCHREVHYGLDGEKVNKELMAYLKRLEEL